MQTTYRASYSGHYRKGLIRLLEVLEFRSGNSHRPVLDALDLVHRYRGATDLTYYPAGEAVPVHAGLSGDWADLAYKSDKSDKRARQRVVRAVYEIRAFEALCDQLKCKGFWVAGAMEFRDPDQDLPRYFAERRAENYAGLNVAESWNAGNSVIYFGQGGDIPANRRDEQELSVLCLRVLQGAVVYLNTLMIQDVLDEGLAELSPDDLRGLTPLFWSNIAPYGQVRLNMSSRLALRGSPAPPLGGGDRDSRPADPAPDKEQPS